MVSKVEIVVVGEESVDSEMAEDDTLSRCSKDIEGSFVDTKPLSRVDCRGSEVKSGRSS